LSATKSVADVSLLFFGGWCAMVGAQAMRQAHSAAQSQAGLPPRATEIEQQNHNLVDYKSKFEEVLLLCRLANICCTRQYTVIL
jgi:hypothetical protein